MKQKYIYRCKDINKKVKNKCLAHIFHFFIGKMQDFIRI